MSVNPVEIAEPAALVNDKMNGFAVMDKSACPCTCSNQAGESSYCFRPRLIMRTIVSQ